MDPKLTLLFMLIGTIIGLSHLSEGMFAKWRSQQPLRLTDTSKGRRNG